jgi:hypothetical protein
MKKPARLARAGLVDPQADIVRRAIDGGQRPPYLFPRLSLASMNCTASSCSFFSDGVCA